MLSILHAVPVKEKYSLDVCLTDVGTGAIALILIFVIALGLGGFMFWQPWLFAIVSVAFAAGAMRGSSAGTVWLKALAMSAFYLVIQLFFLNWESTTVATVFFGMSTLLISTAGGILYRRRYQRLQAKTSTDN